MQDRERSFQDPPAWSAHSGWLAALGVAGLMALALLVGIATGWLQEPLDVAASPELAAVDRPPPQVVDACNRVAAEALVGAAAGSGTAAQGAEVGDGEARDGSPYGAAAGTLLGVSEENRRTRAGRDAYRECLAGRGY